MEYETCLQQPRHHVIHSVIDFVVHDKDILNRCLCSTTYIFKIIFIVKKSSVKLHKIHILLPCMRFCIFIKKQQNENINK